MNHLFDFDIDEYISFLQMRQMFKLSDDSLQSWTDENWMEFIREHTVMEFKIVESAAEGLGGNEQAWGEIAKNMLNSFSQSVLVNQD